MKRALILLVGLTLAAGLLFGTPSSGQSAPISSTLPNIQIGTSGLDLTPVHYRPYWHCHRRCVRWRYGYCYRWRRYCHGGYGYYY